MAGIVTQAQFNPAVNSPIDIRNEVANKTARNSITKKYSRMLVVTLNDEIAWRLKPTGGQPLSTWGTSDAHWEEDGISSGSVGEPTDIVDIQILDNELTITRRDGGEYIITLNLDYEPTYIPITSGELTDGAIAVDGLSIRDAIILLANSGISSGVIESVTIIDVQGDDSITITNVTSS